MSNKVLTVLDERTVVKPGFWRENPPTGGTGGGPAYFGEVAVPAGQKYVDITFPGALASLPIAPFCALRRTDASLPLILFVDSTNVTTGGFRANLSDVVPSAGYLLSCQVFLGGDQSNGGGGGGGNAGTAKVRYWNANPPGSAMAVASLDVSGYSSNVAGNEYASAYTTIPAGNRTFTASCAGKTGSASEAVDADSYSTIIITYDANGNPSLLRVGDYSNAGGGSFIYAYNFFPGQGSVTVATYLADGTLDTGPTDPFYCQGPGQLHQLTDYPASAPIRFEATYTGPSGPPVVKSLNIDMTTLRNVSVIMSPGVGGGFHIFSLLNRDDGI